METTKREELLTRMIRIYGFEHEEVLNFAELMESNISDKSLEVLVECHEQYPVLDPWDEDYEEDF